MSKGHIGESILDTRDVQALRHHSIKTDMFLSWKSLHGLRNSSRNLWAWFTVPSTNAG